MVRVRCTDEAQIRQTGLLEDQRQNSNRRRPPKFNHRAGLRRVCSLVHPILLNRLEAAYLMLCLLALLVVWWKDTALMILVNTGHPQGLRKRDKLVLILTTRRLAAARALLSPLALPALPKIALNHYFLPPLVTPRYQQLVLAQARLPELITGSSHKSCHLLRRQTIPRLSPLEIVHILSSRPTSTQPTR